MKYSNRVRLAAAALIFVALAAACAVPAGQAPGSAPAETAPGVAPTAAPAGAPERLRIGIPYVALVDPGLLDILALAQKDMNLPLELAVPKAAYDERADQYKTWSEKYGLAITGALEVTTPLPYLAGSGGCFGVLPPDNMGIFDLYMIDSQCAAHMFAVYGFEPAPDMVQPLPNLKAPFTHGGQLAAVPLGTMPMLAIGNADLLEKLKVNPKALMDWSWDEFMTMAKNGAGDPAHYRVLLPSDASALVVGCQSALGSEGCSEGDIFSGAVIAQLGGLIEQGNELFKLKNVAFPQELENEGGSAKVFAAGNVAAAYAPVGLLIMLGQLEAQGTMLPPVALGRFPKIKESGGSAETRAWAVPASSKQKDPAWNLVKWLDNSAAMKPWLLAHGMLPATTTGWDQLLKDPGQVSGLLPKDVLNQDSLQMLVNITEASKAWQIPAPVKLSEYNEMMTAANEIMTSWAREKAPIGDLLAKLLEALKGLSQP